MAWKYDALCKLTDEQCLAICDEYLAGTVSSSQLARRYHVHPWTIRSLLTGKSRPHLKRPVGLLEAVQAAKGQKLNADRVREARVLARQHNWTIKQMQQHLGVSYMMAFNVYHRLSWADVGSD